MSMPLSTTFVSARRAKLDVRFLLTLFAFFTLLLGVACFSTAEATALRQERLIRPAKIAIDELSSSDEATGVYEREVRVEASHKSLRRERIPVQVIAARWSANSQVLRLHRDLSVPHMTRHRPPRPGPQRRLPAARRDQKQSASAAVGISLFEAVSSVKTEGDSQLYKLHCTYWL